ncbi:MAG: quinolinate synthase NadA [Thermoguttaceae bacterium]|nr:quinolinate synthase NadA [Thermoguttaceae bacterium]
MEDLHAAITRLKERLGASLCIMGHHDQNDALVRHCDITGDSLELARRVPSVAAEHIVFCGVYFMQETADILMNRPEKIAARGGRRALVMSPDLTAGCPMADMITVEQAENWKCELSQVVNFDDFTPVTYVNSSAATKAFCGAYGGSVCTSANAATVVAAALERRPKLLFMPDSRLGRTTALSLGVPESEIVVWTPGAPLGGLTVEQIRAARVILWDGCCPVHQRFSADAIRKIKEENPDAQVWVHPESPGEIVALSDGYGSTTKLIEVVKNAPNGATIAVGTEWKLVDRIRRDNPTKNVLWPGDEPAVCDEMSKATLAKIAWALENWAAGTPVNVVVTPENVAADAYRALQSM